MTRLILPSTQNWHHWMVHGSTGKISECRESIVHSSWAKNTRAGYRLVLDNILDTGAFLLTKIFLPAKDVGSTNESIRVMATRMQAAKTQLTVDTTMRMIQFGANKLAMHAAIQCVIRGCIARKKRRMWFKCIPSWGRHCCQNQGLPS